jgi:hypothetical protein
MLQAKSKSERENPSPPELQSELVRMKAQVDELQGKIRFYELMTGKKYTFK